MRLSKMRIYAAFLLALCVSSAGFSSDAEWVAEVFQKKVNEDWPKGAEVPGPFGGLRHPFHDWGARVIVLGDRKFKVTMARFSTEEVARRLVYAVRGLVSAGGGNARDAKALGLDEYEIWRGYWALARRGKVAIMITPEPQISLHNGFYDAMIWYLTPLIEAEEEKAGGLAAAKSAEANKGSESKAAPPGGTVGQPTKQGPGGARR